MEGKEISAFLQLQCGLLGNVAPELRAVSFDFFDDTIEMYFFYDGEVSDNLFDLASCSTIEVDSILQDREILRLDYPQMIPAKGKFVYLRKEPKFCLSKELEPLFKYDRNIKPEQIPHYQSKIEPCVFWEKYDLPLRVYIVLVVGEALLGEIDSNLRKVALEWWNGGSIYIHFYYDGEITQSNRDSVERVMKKVSLGFCGRTFLQGRCIRIDKEYPLPVHGETIYSRVESELAQKTWRLFNISF